MTTFPDMPMECPAFDRTAYTAWLMYLGHSPEFPGTFRKKGEGLTHCDVEAAARAGLAVWTTVNQPRPGRERRKPKNADIARVLNVQMEGEYPHDPGRVHALFTDLRTWLTELGVIVPGTALTDSGAGVHFEIPIPPIVCADHGGGDMVNAAVANIIDRHIRPLFNELAAKYDLTGKATLSCCDISRIMSGPGTWRPGGTKASEVDYLLSGYRRRFLAPHDGEQPARVESPFLAYLIRTEAAALLEAKRTAQANPARPATSSGNIAAEEAWIIDWVTGHSLSGNRSNDFQRVVLAALRKFGETPIAHAVLIDQLTGGKYGPRAGREVARSVANAPAPDNHYRSIFAPAPPDSDESARLLARCEVLEAERDEARGALAEAQAIVDRLTTEGSAEIVQRQAEEIARLKEEKRQLLAIVTDRTLKPIERVVGAVVMDKANAYRHRVTLGDDLDPPKEQRVRAGETEVEVGIGTGTFARYMKPVVARGHLGYRIIPDPEGQANGRPRSIGLVKPGDGQLHVMEDLRRKRDREKKQVQRDEEAREAERNKARIAELERAAERADAHGCMLCGDPLLATGYYCACCNKPYSVETIAATGLVDESLRKTPVGRDHELADDMSENTLYKISDDSSEKSPAQPCVDQEVLDELLGEVERAGRRAYNTDDGDEFSRRRAQASALRIAMAACERIAHAS